MFGGKPIIQQIIIQLNYAYMRDKILLCQVSYLHLNTYRHYIHSMKDNLTTWQIG